MAYGQAGHLGLCFQESFGTTLTASPAYVPLIAESVAETINALAEEGMYRRLAESPYHEGTHEIGGEVRTEAHPVYVGHLLKAALGRVTTTAQDSAYVHEFLPAATDWDGYAAVPPMTLELHRDVGSAFVYGDVLATGLALELAHGQLLSATMEVLGGRLTQQAPSSPSYAAGRPWTWDVASAAYAGEGIADLRQLTVSFANQLTAQHTLSGGVTPHRIKRGGPQHVRVEGAFLLHDQRLYQAFRAQEEAPLALTLTGEAVGSGYNALLTLEVPRLRFTELAPQMGGPGPVEVSFSAAGMVDAASGYALRVTLTNTQPGY